MNSTKYNKNNPTSIQTMFGSIAKSYDTTNAALSLQMHRYWNSMLVKNVIQSDRNSGNFLDLCCGTGEIAAIYLKNYPESRDVYLLDFCEEMLNCAKEKIHNLPKNTETIIHYIQADAQVIPLPSESVSYVTIAYGIRNVKNPSACIQEAFRVLRPGGTLGILELTQPKNRLLRFGHGLYLRFVLPLLGRFLTSNQNAYEYLCSSIQNFIKPHELAEIFVQAGFQKTHCKPMTGGIATLILGKKPTVEKSE